MFLHKLTQFIHQISPFRRGHIPPRWILESSLSRRNGFIDIFSAGCVDFSNLAFISITLSAGVFLLKITEKDERRIDRSNHLPRGRRNPFIINKQPCRLCVFPPIGSCELNGKTRHCRYTSSLLYQGYFSRVEVTILLRVRGRSSRPKVWTRFCTREDGLEHRRNFSMRDTPIAYIGTWVCPTS
jgi:hypothetical protein